MSNREEVFDWAAYWPETETTTTTVPALYTPTPVRQAPPRLHVRETPDGIPYYVADIPPQPLPAYDPLPARMHGAALLGFSWCAGLALVECASWVFFKGLNMAEHAVIAISIAVVLAAVAIVALKFVGGIRVSNVRIGNNSSFTIGSGR